MDNRKLIQEAEDFAVGCSRDRLELRLVDALKSAEAALKDAQRDRRLLSELENAGVDNWDGFEYVDWTYVDTGFVEEE